MKVRVINKPFRRHAVGDEFEVRPQQAKVLVHLKRAEIVRAAAPTYQTRMMTAEPVAAPIDPAPYGYKADGTPRLRPGRPTKVAE